MKNTEAQKNALERMRPGHITAQGFLGPDTRSLADIIEADEEELRRLGVDPEEAAAYLERLRDEGQKGLGEPIGVDDRWVVTTGDARGMLPCPWSDGLYHKNSIRIQEEDGSLVLICSDLSIHLLRVHHFLQGKGSAFRLEPATLAKLLSAR